MEGCSTLRPSLPGRLPPRPGFLGVSQRPLRLCVRFSLWILQCGRMPHLSIQRLRILLFASSFDFQLSTVNFFPSLNLNIFKPNPPQQPTNRRLPVLRRHRQNPILQRRLRQLPLRLLPHFALQKRIRRRKQPCLTRINPRLCVIQTRSKNLRRRQLDRSCWCADWGCDGGGG